MLRRLVGVRVSSLVCSFPVARSVSSFSEKVQALVKDNKTKEAIELYEEAEGKNQKIDGKGVSSLVSALIDSKDTENTIKILTSTIKNNIKLDQSIQSKGMHFFLNSENLQGALILYSQIAKNTQNIPIQSSNNVSTALMKFKADEIANFLVCLDPILQTSHIRNFIISHLIQRKEKDLALTTIIQTRGEEYNFLPLTTGNLATLFFESSDPDGAYQLWETLQKTKEVNQVVLAKFLTGFLRAKQIQRGKEMLAYLNTVKYELKGRNLLFFTLGFLQTEQTEKAAALLKRAVLDNYPSQPDETLYNTVLTHFATMRLNDGGCRFWEDLVERGELNSDTISPETRQTVLRLYSYATTFNEEKVYEYFNKWFESASETPKHLQFMINSVIHGSIACERITSAFEFIEECLLPVGSFPDPRACTTLLTACAEGQFLKLALAFFHFTKKTYPNFVNIIHYNAVINVCAKAAQDQQAINLLEELKGKGIKPDTITYNSVIESCMTNKKLSQAIAIYREMKVKNIKADAYTYNHLINCCAVGSDLDKALVFYDTMIEKSIKIPVFLYNKVIELCLESRRPERVLEIYETMKKLKVQPNDHTATLLTTYHANNK